MENEEKDLMQPPPNIWYEDFVVIVILLLVDLALLLQYGRTQELNLLRGRLVCGLLINN